MNLFSGSGGSNQTQQTNSKSTSETHYAPWYEDYTKNILSRATDLSNQPFQSYDVEKMFARPVEDIEKARGIVRGFQGAYQPYYNSAFNALNAVNGYDPMQSAQPWLQQAGALPGGFQAGSGYLTQGAGAWNAPGVSSSYMNPYMTGALGYSQQLANQNFFENVLPKVNESFIKSGGAFGREGNNESLARMVRDFNNASIGQMNTAASGNWWNAANQFNTDQNRLINAGGALGNLANSTIGTFGNLANTASGITQGAVNSGIGKANAYSNLGGALSNTNLQNANALLQIGNQFQGMEQGYKTAGYNQFQQGVQWPYQMVNFLNNASRGLQIPSTTTNTSQSTTTQSGSSNASPSPFSTILGLGSTLMGMPGVGSAIGGALGGLFGGGISNAGSMGSGAGGMYTPGDLGPQGSLGGLGNNGMPWAYRRGGYIARRTAPRRYAAGGNVAIAKGIGALSNQGPSMRAMMGRQGRPPQMMPPGLPPMPPPIAAGALRGAGRR